MTRVTHWLFFLAFLALVGSGLQIFNAAPFLDASDKTDRAHRVLEISSPAQGLGATTLFGHTFNTSGWLGWTDDGMGGVTGRAFPAWSTIPGFQDLADGRTWHFFFAWLMVLCGVAYIVWAVRRGDLQQLILRPSDVPKILPMQLYYFRLRHQPPAHGKYNPLQKTAYTFVIFIVAPLLILSGLALAPSFDAAAPWVIAFFGGRQFARLWHFVLMIVLCGFLVTHVVLVATTGLRNHIASMVTGRYRLGPHDGVGA